VSRRATTDVSTLTALGTPAAPDNGRFRVLVVEDDDVIGHHLRTGLRGNSHHRREPHRHRRPRRRRPRPLRRRLTNTAERVKDRHGVLDAADVRAPAEDRSRCGPAQYAAVAFEGDRAASNTSRAGAMASKVAVPSLTPSR
jgi:hypothetical protein